MLLNRLLQTVAPLEVEAIASAASAILGILIQTSYS